MALGAQIFKVQIDLSNLNTHQYEEVNLTIALHPSETEERMMFRLIAFLISMHERLEFTDGLDNPDLPDIWQKNLMGDIEHWIELGQPDEKKVKKASGRSEKVSIFTYDSFKAENWFNKIKAQVNKNNKVTVYNLREVEPGSLSKLVNRSLNLNCMIEDETLFLSNDDDRVEISFTTAISM